MRITPLNLVFASLLGFLALKVQGIFEMSKYQAREQVESIKIWHGVAVIAIVLIDIVFRALIADTKKLWLIESLFIVFVAGVVQSVLIITGTSLFT